MPAHLAFDFARLFGSCKLLGTEKKYCFDIGKSKGMREFYDRVMAGQKRCKKIAIVAVAKKLLSIMRAMMLTGELFNEELVN